MSTRSYICKELRTTKDTGMVLGIYCHFDGYEEHNGRILLEYYSSREKVNKLMKLGNLSMLAEKLEPEEGKPHNFGDWQWDVCLAYGRDRGEKGQSAKRISLNELLHDSWIEYVYLYTLDNEWKLAVLNSNGEIMLTPITPVYPDNLL